MVSTLPWVSSPSKVISFNTSTLGTIPEVPTLPQLSFRFPRICSGCRKWHLLPDAPDLETAEELATILDELCILGQSAPNSPRTKRRDNRTYPSLNPEIHTLEDYGMSGLDTLPTASLRMSATSWRSPTQASAMARRMEHLTRLKDMLLTLSAPQTPAAGAHGARSSQDMVVEGRVKASDPSQARRELSFYPVSPLEHAVRPSKNFTFPQPSVHGPAMIRSKTVIGIPDMNRQLTSRHSKFRRSAQSEAMSLPQLPSDVAGSQNLSNPLAPPQEGGILKVVGHGQGSFDISKLQPSEKFTGFRSFSTSPRHQPLQQQKKKQEGRRGPAVEGRSSRRTVNLNMLKPCLKIRSTSDPSHLQTMPKDDVKMQRHLLRAQKFRQSVSRGGSEGKPGRFRSTKSHSMNKGHILYHETAPAPSPTNVVRRESQLLGVMTDVSQPASSVSPRGDGPGEGAWAFRQNTAVY